MMDKDLEDWLWIALVLVLFAVLYGMLGGFDRRPMPDTRGLGDSIERINRDWDAKFPR